MHRAAGAATLRVSVTDRCNLRCAYCMPAGGLAWLPVEETLTDDEVVRLIRVAVVRLGVERVRFTGGEPLLRPGLERIVASASAMGGPGGAPGVGAARGGGGGAGGGGGGGGAARPRGPGNPGGRRAPGPRGGPPGATSWTPRRAAPGAADRSIRPARAKRSEPPAGPGRSPV